MRPNAPTTAGENTAAPTPQEHSFEVKNFTEADTLQVKTWYPPEGCSVKTPLVDLIQREGSMSFHHGLTPGQARQMAAQLLLCADAIEALQ